MDMTQKDRLKQRARPSVTQSILIDDPTEATRQAQRAAQVYKQAVRSEDKAEIKRTKAALTRATNKLDACYEHITFRSLPPAVYETLIGEHPPTAEQMAAAPGPDERPQWNRDTFRPALLEACAENDMTVDDWVDFLKEHSSRGEGDALFVAALAVNENARLPEAAMLPKGSPLTGNSLWNSM